MLLLSFFICCPSLVMNLAIYGHRQAILTPSAFLKLHISWAKQLLCVLAEPGGLGCRNFSLLQTPEESLKMKGLLCCFWESDFAAIFMSKLGVFSSWCCNVLDTNIPTDSGLAVVISRHVSYSIELESDSKSWSVWARPVMNCPFKYCSLTSSRWAEGSPELPFCLMVSMETHSWSRLVCRIVHVGILTANPGCNNWNRTCLQSQCL